MGIFNIHLPKDINIHLTIKQESDNPTLELLIQIKNQILKLMSNTDLALSDLQAILGTLQKVQGETSTLLQKITDLENATTADTPQSVLDAIAAVKAQAGIIDALVPDAPVTPPPTV